MSTEMLSSDQLLRRTRILLSATAALTAVFWACGAGLTVWALARLAYAVMPVPAGWPVGLAVTAGLAAAALSLWRDRPVWRRRNVALWLEEKIPGLRYALLVLTGDAPPARTRQLWNQVEQAVAEGPTMGQMIGRHLRVQTVRPALLVLAAALLLGAQVLFGGQMAQRLVTDDVPEVTTANRFLDLHGELIPPGYTGWPAMALERVDTIRGLTGSTLVLHGTGSAEGIVAQLRAGQDADRDVGPGDAQTTPQTPSGAGIEAEAAVADAPTPLPDMPGEPGVSVQESAALARGPELHQDGDGWELTLTMPETPAALVLSDDRYRRILTLEPVVDNAPVVSLHLPKEDLLLRDASGTLELAAGLRDDIGLAEARFEIIVASGEGEGNFEFREVVLEETRFDPGIPSGELAAQVPLASFGLQPGGQLSIRAVAQDRNDLSGPGIGWSETRTIRIARPDDGVEIDIVPRPPAVDESLMSLRMLIRLTERLDARRPGMARDAFVEEAMPLSGHATDIRNKIDGMVEEIGEGGVFDVPPLLLEAQAAMWEGARAMAVAETGDALPHLRRAHEALKLWSNAAKYYLRGQAEAAYVDIDKARMTGAEKVVIGPRKAADIGIPARQRLARQFDAALRRLPWDRARAVEDLTLLRIDALRDWPQAAAPLEQALAALRGEDHGADPKAQPYPKALGHLQQVRAQLEGAPTVLTHLPQWGHVGDGSEGMQP